MAAYNRSLLYYRCYLIKSFKDKFSGHKAYIKYKTDRQKLEL